MGAGSQFFQYSVDTTAPIKAGERPSIWDWGARPSNPYNHEAIARAIVACNNKPGSDLKIPGGYNFQVQAPIVVPPSNFGNVGITISGDGRMSKISRTANMPSGQGLFDVTGSRITFRNFLVEGETLTPVGLKYNRDFMGVGGNDPLADVLTMNTSFWIHAGCRYIKFEGMHIEHTGGYAILANADTQDILEVDVLESWFENNRPHLFGTDDADLTYGAWTGGILMHGDGRTDAPFMVRGHRVRGCHFRRGTGNQIWQHLYGFESLHERILIQDNDAMDIGLDFILVGGVFGGNVSGNKGRRIGYVCTDDASQSTPKWQAGIYATGLDTSGVSIGVDYSDNEMVNCNGDCYNLDGFGHGQVSNCTGVTSKPGELFYDEDQVGVEGWAGSTVAGGPNYAHGLISSSTSQRPEAGEDIAILGCHFINMSGGAILLFAARGAQIRGNFIDHPADATLAPIVLGNIGDGDYARTMDTVAADNTIVYRPTSPMPVVMEYPYGGAFVPTDVNWVAGNKIITSSGMAYEFMASSGSGSTTQVEYSSNYPGISTGSSHIVARTGFAEESALKWFFRDGGLTEQHMQLQGFWSGAGQRGPLLNISRDGLPGTGIYATGARTSSAFQDAIVTGKLYGDAFLVLTDTTYGDVDADLLDGTCALLRFKSTVGYIEQSISVSGSARVWGPLAGGGSGTFVAPGADTQIIYNKAGFPFADAGLVWDYNIGVLEVLNASGGIYTTGTAFNAIQAPSGGMFAMSFTSQRNDGDSGFILSRSTAVARDWGLNVGSDGGLYVRDRTGAVDLAIFSTSGTVTIPGAATGTATLTVSVGYVQAAEGFASAGTAVNTVNIPSGGGFALVWISQRNDGDSGFVLSRTSATAREWGFNVGSDGGLYVRDRTGARNLAVFSTSGTVTMPGNASGTATLTITTGYIQAAEGFASAGTATNTVNIPLGGVTALSLISIRGDGDSGLVLSNTVSVPRDWGFNVGTDGHLYLRDRTGSQNILDINTTQVVTLHKQLVIEGIASGQSLLVQAGYIDSMEGLFSRSTSYQGIQGPSGGVWARSLGAEKYTQLGISAGVPTVTTGQGTFSAGAIYWDSSGTPGLKYYNGSGWASFGGGTPAGADTQIQYNSSGAFAASSTFVFNYTTNRLGINAIPTHEIHVSRTVGNVPSIFIEGEKSGSAAALFQGNSYSQSAANGGTQYLGYGIRGTMVSASATQASDFLVSLMGGGYGSTFQDGPKISFVATSTWSGSNSESEMRFYTIPSASTTVTERMRLLGNGVLLLNRTVGDGSGAFLMLAGSVSATSGYYTSSTAFNAIQAPSGGVYCAQVLVDHPSAPLLKVQYTGGGDTSIEPGYVRVGSLAGGSYTTINNGIQLLMTVPASNEGQLSVANSTQSLRMYVCYGGGSSVLYGLYDGATEILFNEAAGAIDTLHLNGGGTGGARLTCGTLYQLSFNGTQVLGVRDTGWGAWSGTPNKANGRNTGAVTLVQLAENHYALLQALTTHGIIGV